MKKNIYLSVTFIQIFVSYMSFFAGYASLNLLSPYLATLGAGKWYLGFFMNVPAFELFLFVILSSRFSNKINKKKALIFGYILSIISTAAMFSFHKDLVILLLLRILSGISYVFTFSMIANFVFDYFPEKARTAGIAVFGLAAVISNPLGIFLAENLLARFQPRYLFLLTTVFYFITLIIIWFFKEPPNEYNGKESHTFFMILKRRDLLQLILLAVIAGGAMSVFPTFIPCFTRERLGKAAIFLFFVPSAFVAVIIRMFFPKFSSNIKKIRLITFSLSALFVALLLLVFLKKEFQLIIIGFVYGFGYSLLHPMLSAGFVERGTEDQKVVLNNTYLSVNMLGNITITTGLGFLGDLSQTTAIFIAAMVIVNLGIIISVLPKKIFTTNRSLNIERKLMKERTRIEDNLLSD